MRDHHFALLHPRVFLKWRDRHQVGFSFSEGAARSSAARCRRMQLQLPTAFSHCPQEGAAGDTWHFPLSAEAAGGESGVWLAAWRVEGGEEEPLLQ